MGRELKVVAPESDFSGVVAGVAFTNGEAKTDNSSALRYFREAGYGVDGSEPVRAGSAGPEESEDEVLEKPKDSADLVEETVIPAKKAAKAPAKKAASKEADATTGDGSAK